METILIKRESSGLSYPVGSNMKKAKEMAYDCAHMFEQIKEFEYKNVNIFCRGSSGSILASLFASKIPNDCTICYVRKHNEDSHDGSGGYHKFDFAINIIIDDFVCSGHTLMEIYGHMQEKREHTVDVLIVESCPEILHRNNFPFQPKYFIHI